MDATQLLLPNLTPLKWIIYDERDLRLIRRIMTTAKLKLALQPNVQFQNKLLFKQLRVLDVHAQDIPSAVDLMSRMWNKLMNLSIFSDDWCEISLDDVAASEMAQAWPNIVLNKFLETPLPSLISPLLNNKTTSRTTGSEHILSAVFVTQTFLNFPSQSISSNIKAFETQQAQIRPAFPGAQNMGPWFKVAGLNNNDFIPVGNLKAKNWRTKSCLSGLKGFADFSHCTYVQYHNLHLGRSSYIMIKTILVLPDPGQKKTWLQLQEHTYTNWVLTSLPHQEVEYLLGIMDLDGLIFVATSQRLSSKEVPKGHRVVHINEVLLMWHTIDTSTKNCLQACYMNFRTFSEIIFMSLDRLQKAMANFAAVWGGLDLTKNHRLEDVLPVWPGTLECRAASHDRNTISLLDSIAQDITKSHRPTTQLITPESKPAACACQHVVVKHEASTSSQHIKYPWNEEMPTDQEGYQLLMQPYVPEWDQAEVFKAHAEIQQFLVLMLEAFIAGEETRLQQSSLRVSAWLDLSVITNPESRKLQYFVTGISQGPVMEVLNICKDSGNGFWCMHDNVVEGGREQIGGVFDFYDIVPWFEKSEH
ncbi:hypothetical protein BDR06DRAFT_1037468 [Suillus hirtellus]|nr:hypothetical protein BDR06DRAFT_1037468 [Suillus hirtellus]